MQVAAAIGALTMATACGADADAESSGPVTWDAADPCSLATFDTIESLVTPAPKEGVPTDSAGRTSCLWGSPESLNTVTVTLAALPRSIKPLHTVTVGGMTGPVLAESKYHCILELQSDSGVLAVEAKFGLDAALNPDTSCERVIPLAEHAVKELRWA
ncbi:MAG: hypothetical protein GX610_15460 [Rhodococcus sp.]|nr:hypothetical protein [Rhodococcus sp. (in: high G+C Gram-positive bacteria)]